MKDKTTSKKRRRYEPAFKSNLLRLNAEGRTVSSLSQSFGVNENLIYRWKKEAKEARFSGQNEDLGEVLELRTEIKELKEERDILKKALAIFSRHP